MTPSHRFNPSTKRIEAIPAEESQESQSDDAALAFIEANADKIKTFLRDLLAAYGERAESEENRVGESVRQASTAQLGRTKSEEAESAEKARGKSVRAFRNGRDISVGA